jgi:hypothetical protein
MNESLTRGICFCPSAASRCAGARPSWRRRASAPLRPSVRTWASAIPRGRSTNLGRSFSAQRMSDAVREQETKGAPLASVQTHAERQATTGRRPAQVRPRSAPCVACRRDWRVGSLGVARRVVNTCERSWSAGPGEACCSPSPLQGVLRAVATAPSQAVLANSCLIGLSRVKGKPDSSQKWISAFPALACPTLAGYVSCCQRWIASGSRW